MAAVGLGAALSTRTLTSGLAQLAEPTAALPSLGMGSMSSLYGMDPNNLDTMGLVQALHYRR
jgi:hypothetical protein